MALLLLHFSLAGSTASAAAVTAQSEDKGAFAVAATLAATVTRIDHKPTDSCCYLCSMLLLSDNACSCWGVSCWPPECCASCRKAQSCAVLLLLLSCRQA